MTHLTPLFAPTVTAATQATLIDDTLAAVRRHFGMPLAFLSAFEDNDVVFHSVSTDQDMPLIMQGDRRRAEGSYCKAVRDGDLPHLLNDTQMNRFAMSLPETTMLPIGAMIAVPVTLCDGSTYGMFCCLSHVPMPCLNDRDVAIMTTFAGLVAEVVGATIDTDRLGQSVRQQIEDVITDRDFQLLLQPIVSLTETAVMGAEALCRFRSTPYRSPDRWFADARRIGLQHELERTVIIKTLDLLADLPRALKLSINISPDMMISGELPELIDGPFSDRIIFELTEHDHVGHLTDLQHQMKKLRKLGAQIAVDDLGATYDSLNTVMQIKPDIVKLDREMVRGIHLDPANRALAAGIVHFAAAIGAQVVAEGIERQDEANAVRALGVPFGQGFLLGRPGGLNALQARTFTC